MTHAEFELELVEALNILLEDERASVEMEIALASGATEYSERDALATMGAQDIHFCDQLRSQMELAGLSVTPQINGVVFHVLGAERYDDRLRAFAQHQRVVAEHARELQESNLEGALRDALEGISATHEQHSDWGEQRADAFAATRTLEFGPPTHPGQAPADAQLTDGASYLLGEALSESAAPADDEAAPADMPPSHANDAPAEPLAEPVAEEPPTRPRASRAAAPRASAAKAKPAAKPAAAKTKPAAKPAAKPAKPAAKPAPRPRATAKDKPTATDAPAPRRTRRTSASEES